MYKALLKKLVNSTKHLNIRRELEGDYPSELLSLFLQSEAISRLPDRAYITFKMFIDFLKIKGQEELANDLVKWQNESGDPRDENYFRILLGIDILPPEEKGPHNLNCLADDLKGKMMPFLDAKDLLNLSCVSKSFLFNKNMRSPALWRPYLIEILYDQKKLVDGIIENNLIQDYANLYRTIQRSRETYFFPW